MVDRTLRREESVLFIIDIQPSLVSVMSRGEILVKNSHILLEGAHAYNIPAVYSEQYVKGLGHTEPKLLENLKAMDAAYVEKTRFNAYLSPLVEQLHSLRNEGRNKVIVCGMETHICVYQTIRALLEDEFEVFVPVDAVDSRTDLNRETALHMVRDMGASWTTTESVLFDWMGDAKDPAFKVLQKLIK